MNIPRPEYPRPQMVRDRWINLNGSWAFTYDQEKNGRSRNLQRGENFDRSITLPFCPESILSGVGNTDFINCLWYSRAVTLPEDWTAAGRRTLLHIGACDYRTEVWINGRSVGTHIGGYISFSFDITDALQPGENRIVICAEDDLRSQTQPSGKQSQRQESYECFYTRTTGIWQTVWMENTPASYLVRTRMTPDIAAHTLLIEAVCENASGLTLHAEASYHGHPVGSAQATVSGQSARMMLPLSELHLWEIGSPCLYDLTFTLGEDHVTSYFGMREVYFDGKCIRLNGKPVFQRLILDQGFYPDGIYTAPTEEELIADITRSMDMGFQGARLHEKIFEPRFLYHCDRLGYIVWGEFPNWGLDLSRDTAWQAFLPEWTEEILRDYNHPAIVGWCPANETQIDQNPELIRTIIAATRALDNTRPVIDCSGWFHVEGCCDVSDTHDYEQNPEIFAAHYDELNRSKTIRISYPVETYARPVFVSEYGGIWWNPERDDGWGYGERVHSEEEFIARYRGLTDALLDNPSICALCYTQLTDVEQEQNGLYTYDRRAKFPPEVLAPIMQRKAAIEK